MSCNCPTPNQCPPSELCLCGVTLTISNSDGSIVETLQGNIFQGEGSYYYVATGSTIFNGILPTGYELTISYNYELERWEMTYFNEELGLTILLGVLYGVGPGDCPTNNCWDLDCNAVAFNVLGVFDTYFPWTGEYTNGKKSYTFSSDWSGPVINYRIYWIADSSTVPGTGAPVGTPGWILEEEVGLNVWQPAGYLFNDNQCPYGQYLAEFEGSDTRFSFTDLGVTGFDMKSVATDCGCCDTEVYVTLYDGEGYYTYTLTLSYDEYGNVLGLNGYNYYTYSEGEVQYYLYVNSEGNWVVNTLFNNSETEIAYTPVTDDCPFGSYTTNTTIGDVLACVDCVKVSFTYLGVNYEFEIPTTGTDDGRQKYGITGITVGPYTNANIDIDWNNIPNPQWNFAFLGSVISVLADDIPCPLGNFPDSTTPEALFTNIVISVCGTSNNVLVSVKGTECFDCCDYYTPHNRNLLKKKKAIFVNEISSIRNKELFGFKCGPDWEELYKKHLIFDVLWCLPYGVICEDQEQCLIDKLNENCNC